LAYDHLTTIEFIEELEGVVKKAEEFASQLEKLIGICSGSSTDSLAYMDFEMYLRTQIQQLIETVTSLEGSTRKRVGELSPKASLLRHRLEYLENRRAIGMISEEVYSEARNEILGRVGDIEDSMMYLMKLINQVEMAMMKIESLLKPPELRRSADELVKHRGSSTITLSPTNRILE